MAPKFGIQKTWTAHNKYQEALFFYRLMIQAGKAPEFRYFLSAFLSALLASTDEDALKSSRPGYAAWYDKRKSDIKGPPLDLLRALRNAEAHLAGSPIYTAFHLDFGPDGVFLEGEKAQSLTTEPIDLNQPNLNQFRVDEGEKIGSLRPLDVKVSWVWAAEGSPDILKLCERGIACTGEIIDDWQNQGFDK